MRRLIFLMILSIPLLLIAAGCSDKSKEEAQAPPPVPVDTTPIAIDTTPIVPVDTTPPKPELPGMPGAPQGDGYAVQVASCTDEDYARYLVDLWTNRGYEPFVTDFTFDGVSYYRIRLGLYMTYGEAKNVTAELQDRFSLTTWVEQVSY